MRIIVLKTNIKKGLDAVGRVANDSAGALPILKNFLIETADNRIQFSATNLELAVTCFVPGKIIENGGLTVPAGLFSSIISNLQSERINFETEEDNLIIKTDNYEAKIQGIKKEEFPIIPKVEKSEAHLEIVGSELSDALSLVASAAQSSNLRPELNGVFLSYETTMLKLAATDTFRLAEKSLNENQFRSDAETKFKTIIPLKMVHEITRILKEEKEKVGIYFSHNQILGKSESAEIISRLISGEFPDYQPIIPQSLQTEITLNKDELINALKLAGSFTDRLSEVRVIVKEKIKSIEVFSSARGLGENRYLIPAKIKGDPIEIVFNWRFLLDGLKSLTAENIFLGLNGEDRPAILKSVNDTSYFYVLMPIKAG